MVDKKEKGFQEGANYCTMFPDTLLGVNYSYACYLHDREYRNERKKRKTREEADVQLFNEVRKTYNESNKKIIGLIVAFVMYIGVRLFNKRYWVNG